MMCSECIKLPRTLVRTGYDLVLRAYSSKYCEEGTVQQAKVIQAGRGKTQCNGLSPDPPRLALL